VLAHPSAKESALWILSYDPWLVRRRKAGEATPCAARPGAADFAPPRPAPLTDRSPKVSLVNSLVSRSWRHATNTHALFHNSTPTAPPTDSARQTWLHLQTWLGTQVDLVCETACASAVAHSFDCRCRRLVKGTFLRFPVSPVFLFLHRPPATLVRGAAAFPSGGPHGPRVIWLSGGSKQTRASTSPRPSAATLHFSSTKRSMGHEPALHTIFFSCNGHVIANLRNRNPHTIQPSCCPVLMSSGDCRPIHPHAAPLFRSRVAPELEVIGTNPLSHHITPPRLGRRHGSHFPAARPRLAPRSLSDGHASALAFQPRPAGRRSRL
jgi:hypothetical protein